MKSFMRRSLAVVMVLAMLLTMALPAFAAEAHVHTDNTPCEHAGTDAVKIEEVAATCQKNGGKWHTCTACGDVWVTDEVAKDPDNHKWSTEEVSLPATCWRPGYTATKVCENEGCNATQGGEPIAQLTHTVYDAEKNPNGSLVIKEKTLADCLEGGVILYECKCKDVPADDLGSCTYNGEADVTEGPQGHKHELLSTGYQAPTCHLPGWVTIDCTKCDDTFKVAIAAKGHDFVEVVGEPAICYEQGYYAGYYCANEWIEWDENGVGTKKSCSAYYITETGHVAGSEDEPLFTEADLDKEALAIPATDTHNKVLVWNPATDAKPVPEYKGELAYQQANCDPSNESDGWQWWVCAEDGCDWDYKETLEPEHQDDGTYNNVVKPGCTTQGYTEHICSICDKKYVDPDSYTPAQHTWGSEDPANTVYTFVNEEGKTYVRGGGLRELPAGLTATIRFIPYYVSAAQLASDATAQELIANGYSVVAWTVMAPVECGKIGRFVHICVAEGCQDENGAPTAGFLFINVDHVWDGDITDVDSEDDIVKPSCTTPGGYMGTCETCHEEFILSAAMVADYDPDYNPDNYAPTGHKSLEGFITTQAGGVFVKPSAKQAATCSVPGYEEFFYCENENCADSLPNYETAYASRTVTTVPHTYFAADGTTALKPADIAATCSTRAFKVASCVNCGLHIYEDPTKNPSDLDATEFAINGEFTGTFDNEAHKWPVFPDGRPVATAPTCTANGQYKTIYCELCGQPDVGAIINPVVPGALPTEADYIHGKVVNGWKVQITPATCLTNGKVEAVCVSCAEQKTADPDYVIAHPTQTLKTLDATGKHIIAGAEYAKDENGNYLTWQGVYIVISLPAAVTPSAEQIDPDFVVNEGSCAQNGASKDFHANYYTCAECGEVEAITVKKAHTEPDPSTLGCADPVNCTACGEKLADAAGHHMIKTDVIKNDDKDCTTEWYYIIECDKSGCDYSSESDGFVWTDEYKTLAQYVAADEHDYNGLSDGPTCEQAQECVNAGCDYVKAPAVGHENRVGYSKEYTNPTCIAKGFWTIKCPAGEKCDKYVAGDATIVEEGGVKYAVWTETDDASVFADHDYDFNGDGEVKAEDDAYVAQTGDCLNYNVVVYQCKDCYGEAVVESDGFISNGYLATDFKDPTGHKLVDNNTIEDCDEGGCYWKNCEYCFDEAKYNAGEDGMWNTKDWKGEIGYTEKRFTEPTGHWYLSTPAEGATQEEIDAFVAQKIFFDLTCVDLTAHNNPTCADCGVQFKAEDHHNISKEYTLAPTCTTTGLSWKYCTNEGCGYKDILTVEPALGHLDTKWVTDVASTCCEKGSAHLACKVCNAAVKEGELILKNSGLVAATAADLTKSLTKLPHVMEKDTEKSVDPTVHVAGVLVKKCVSTSHKCEYTETQDLGKLDVVEFSATIDNAVKPGHMVFVNGGTIAYTISIDAEAKALWGVQLGVKFDNTKLTYVGYDLGEDNANLFGTMDASGACSTLVGSSGGVVSIMAYVNNTADATVVDAPVNEKVEFVTLYFKINSNTITDYALDRGYVTGIEIDASSIIMTNSTSEAELGKSVYEAITVDADAITVEKLGDANVAKNPAGNVVLSDGLVNILDVQYVQNHVLSQTYDARADIDQNGVVNVLDIVEIQRYIIFAQTYAEMVATAQ